MLISKLGRSTQLLADNFNKKYDAQRIDVSSQTNNQINDLLDNISIKKDTVVVSCQDVWRSYDHEQAIFDHPALQGKRVIISTAGYYNKKYTNLHYHISIPESYYLRSSRKEVFVPLSNNLGYGFSCLNNRTSTDRFILGYSLYKNKLLDNMIFTQNYIESDFENLEYNESPDGIVKRDMSAFDIKKFYEYKNLLPIRLDMHKDLGEINFKFFDNKEGWEIPFEHPAFANAYCFISVEGAIEEYPYSENINLPFCTEKSFKAFITRQIPLTVGARGHYAYLKSLGFEMMEDFLPAGYDNMPFLHKVDAIVATVAKGKEFVQDFYFEHLREIKHNYDLVHSKKVDNLILERVQNILTTT